MARGRHRGAGERACRVHGDALRREPRQGTRQGRGARRLTGEEELIRRAYAAFNARDIDGALALMHPDVDWPNGMDGGRELGHEAVRAYWTRQFGLIDSHVEPQGFERDEEGRIVVDVHQVVRDLDGAVLSDGRVRHVYTLRDGLVVRMDIQEAD